jgi:MFS family permease
LICIPVNDKNKVEISHDTSYIGSSYFLGMVVGIILFPRISEIIGRVKVLYVMVLFGVVSLSGILFAPISVLHL